MTFSARPPHTPVLKSYICNHFVKYLGSSKSSVITIVDGTLGAGGHSLALIQAFRECERKVKIIGIDRDPVALDIAHKNFLENGIDKSSFQFFHGNFVDIKSFSKSHSIDGVLLDLGVSSMQLDNPERGFSFRNDGPLDMRMDKENQKTSAIDIVNTWPEGFLGEAIWRYGEERNWRKIARQIVIERQKAPIETTHQLVKAISPFLDWKGSIRIHPATRTFQGIRMAVNEEFGNLQKVLPSCVDVLNVSGILGVISFHSIEDGIVKNFMKTEPRLKLVKSAPIKADDDEIEANKRSRSAKFRISVRL